MSTRLWGSHSLIILVVTQACILGSSQTVVTSELNAEWLFTATQWNNAAVLSTHFPDRFKAMSARFMRTDK